MVTSESLSGPGTDQYIRLRDGRTLAYTEHGDPAGLPVFFFHGNPGSRLTRHPDVSIAAALGARMITPDRPGYGLSDSQKDRTLLDWPEDVAQLADALEIEQFGIVGWSAGGAYALACLAQLPNRAARCATISGSAPLDRPGAYDGTHEAYRSGFKLAERAIWLFRALLWAQTRAALRDRDRALERTASLLSAGDQAMLARDDVRAQVVDYLPEAARQGVRGMACEAKILVSSWDFRLEEIAQPVRLWCWEEDVIVPPQTGQYLADAIPHAELTVMPDGGHFAWFDHWQEILMEKSIRTRII
jgi:pimeloyl-ACP methyl ester carboxylesterase